MTLIERHRSAARISAPNISFKTERGRDDLETTAFLDKQAFKQFRRPDGAPMRHRESQVGNAGFEVIHEACDRAVVFAAVVGIDAGREFARDGRARRLIGRRRADLEVRPDILRQLGRQPPGRARKANLDRLMMPGAPSEVTRSGSFRPRLFMSSHRLGIFFGARHHVQQHTTAPEPARV